MYKSMLIIGVIALQSLAYAQVSNKDAPFSMLKPDFTRPGTQFTLGITEAAGGGMLVWWASVVRDPTVVFHARKCRELDESLKRLQTEISAWRRKIPESEARRIYQDKLIRRNVLNRKRGIDNFVQIERLDRQLDAIEKKLSQGEYPASQSVIDARISSLSRQRRTVLFQSAAAQESLASARVRVLGSQPGFAKAFRWVRIVGGSLFLIDAASRAYLWYGTAEVPRWVPTADLLRWTSED